MEKKLYRKGVRSVEWGSAIFWWGRGSAPCFLQFQTLTHFFRNYFFYSFALLLTKKRKPMLKKLKLKRSLSLINKEIEQTKKQSLNSTFTIHYKNNLLDELEMHKNELLEKLENKEY
tara:strand:- start:318 stop:668 length:351 start_codon:yes stop_codon:yes gene_type:complete